MPFSDAWAIIERMIKRRSFVVVATTASALFALNPTACSSDANPPALTSPDGGHVIVQPDSSMADSALPDTGQSTATCTDHMMNGQETDVDCGGTTCPACVELQKCVAPTDCMSKNCVANKCVKATCGDHIKNAKETDVDCGGADCPSCLVGKSCVATADCSSKICTNGTCLCTGGMVTIPTALTLGGSYCIDPTEVTKKEYNDFWVANPNLGTNLPTSCAFKTSYTPSAEWPPTLIQNGYNGGDPIHFVDWCDAYAYCAWKGRRLCGAIAGGPNPPTSTTDRLKDAWYNACSALGANTWPYGTSYQPTSCWGSDYFAALDAGSRILPVRDINSNLVTSCQGGAAGLYMMSGSVTEWEDSCDASVGGGDNCQLRGGSFNSSSAQLRCDASATSARNSRTAEIGFRCCL